VSTSLGQAPATETQGGTIENKFPEFSWDYIPRYMHVYKQTAYTDEEIEFLSSFPFITFEKAQGTAEGSVQKGTLKAARAVKKHNPNIKVLYYKNIVIDWPGSASSGTLETIEGGYLQSEDGTYPTVNENSRSRFFDISLPAVQAWWMKDATQMLGDPSIDGIFIDANIKVLEKGYFERGKKVGEEKAEDLIKGYHHLLSKINEEIRPQNIILANLIRARFETGGLDYLHYFDGSYLEGFEHEVGGVSKVDYVAKGIAHAQEAARRGKLLAFTAGLGEAIDEDSSGIGLDETRRSVSNLEAVEERLNYLTALFLVIAEKYTYFYPHDGFVVRAKGHGEQINRTWMHDFPIFKKRLGPPKGPAIKEGYLYTREFEHCSVWLDIEQEQGKLSWK
tara:strand:+ start:3271 stop:4446 length:1176 start_codon:yes stop_codon:yes gene_type:complete